MEICIQKLEKNIEKVLKRDVEDCEAKGLFGYLNHNLQLYSSTRNNSKEVCNEVRTVFNGASKIFKNGDTWPAKRAPKELKGIENVRIACGSDTRNKNTKLLGEFYLPKLDTFQIVVDDDELDYLRNYTKGNLNQENKNKIFTNLKDKNYLPKTPKGKTSILRHNPTLSANSVDVGRLPSDRG